MPPRQRDSHPTGVSKFQICIALLSFVSFLMLPFFAVYLVPGNFIDTNLSDDGKQARSLLWSVTSPSSLAVDNTIVTDGLELSKLIPESSSGLPGIFIAMDTVSSSITSLLTSSSPNHAPQQISELPEVELEQGMTLEDCVFLPDYFYDSDRDELSYNWTCTHSTIEIGLDLYVSVIAPDDWYGVEYAIIQASDPFGEFVDGLMQITVTQVNHPPLIDELPDLGVRDNLRYDFDIWPYIHDLEKSPEELSYSTDDRNCSFIGTVMSVLYPPGTKDTTRPVTITVVDGAQSISCTVNITVSDNYPPTLFPGHLLPAVSFEEDTDTIYPDGQELQYYFMDQEDGQVLTFATRVLGPNVFATVFENQTGSWVVQLNATKDYSGKSYLLVRAIDSLGAIVERTVILEVIEVPDAPVLSLPATFTVVEGQQMILGLGEYIDDPDSSMQSGDFAFTVKMVNEREDEAEYLEWIGTYASALVFEYPVGFLKDHDDSFALEIVATDQTGMVGSGEILIVVSRASGDGYEALALAVAVLATVGGVSGMGAIAYVRRKKPFVIHDMMLVHNDGFLIGRNAARPLVEEEIDQDIFSGMLTAVLNFVEDSMKTSQETLKSFGFENYNVLVKRGVKVYVAVAHEGDLPKNIETSIAEFLETFEKVYAKRIATPTGDIETDFAGVGLLIQGFVNEHSKVRRGRTGKSVGSASASRVRPME